MNATTKLATTLLVATALAACGEDVSEEATQEDAVLGPILTCNSVFTYLAEQDALGRTITAQGGYESGGIDFGFEHGVVRTGSNLVRMISSDVDSNTSGIDRVSISLTKRFITVGQVQLPQTSRLSVTLNSMPNPIVTMDVTECYTQTPTFDRANVIAQADGRFLIVSYEVN